MADLLHRANPADLSIRGDGRTVYGLLVPFDTTAEVNDGLGPFRERFRRGAFSRTIAERRPERVKLVIGHQRMTGVIGRFSDLKEDPAGLVGEARVSKTAQGDDALELVRDGVLDSFSIGFKPVRHQRADDGAIERTEVALREASLLAFPAYVDALVGGVRSAGRTITPEAARLRLLELSK
jgi:uncharacterized protein